MHFFIIFFIFCGKALFSALFRRIKNHAYRVSDIDFCKIYTLKYELANRISINRIKVPGKYPIIK
jgi:hypothetical protein